MYRMMFDRRFESEDDPLFLRLNVLQQLGALSVSAIAETLNSPNS